jgi:hypothetical protein
MNRRLALFLSLIIGSLAGSAQAQSWQANQGYGAPGMAAPGMAMGGQSMAPGMAAPGMAGGGQGMVPGMAAPGMMMAGQGMAPGMSPPGMAMAGQGMVPGMAGGGQGMFPSMPAPGMANVPPGVAGGLAAFPSNAVQSSMGLVPKFDPSFFQKMIANNINAGTVLTGILENDISSNKNKPGDIFSIRLEDGLNVNGNQLIPQQAKILGTISSVVSSRAVHGSPGSIQISLQTLVFPDGSTCPFFGFIQRNTLQDAKAMSASDPLKTGQKYAQRSGYYVMNFFTTRVGFPVHPSNFGTEFKMTKGEVLPIRLNRGIDVSHMTPPVATPATVQRPAPPLSPYAPGQGMPPSAPAQPVALSAGKMGSLSQLSPEAPSLMPNPAPTRAQGYTPVGGYTPAPAANAPGAADSNFVGTSNYVPGLAEPF